MLYNTHIIGYIWFVSVIFVAHMTTDLNSGVADISNGCGIKRRLLGIPEMDRHYRYGMRICVNEIVGGIRDVLRH